MPRDPGSWWGGASRDQRVPALPDVHGECIQVDMEATMAEKVGSTCMSGMLLDGPPHRFHRKAVFHLLASSP